MALYIFSCILVLALTGFFTAYQFGRSWPYASEAGGREYYINVFSAIAAGTAFFFMVLILLIVLARSLQYIGDWLNLYRPVVNWCVWITASICGLFGVWAFFWRRDEKRNQFPEFMERASSHFQVKENVPATYHPYQDDFAFLNWGRPEYTSGRHFAISYSGSKRKKRASSKSSKRKENKGDAVSGIFQLLILAIVVVIAAATAYVLVHFIAKWAIGIEEDWIRNKRGWADSDLVKANPVSS